MAVPSDPTHLELIRDAAIEAGQYNLVTTSTAVTNFANRQFQTIKTEFWEASINDDLLESVTVVTTTAGSRTLILPTDFDHEIWLRIYDGNADQNRGTVVSATTQSVTLASSFSANADGLLGAYLFILEGTGNGQQAQIQSYSNTTKVATVTVAWTTQPDTTSTYLVSEFWYDLPKKELEQGYLRNTRPVRYRLRGRTMEVEPPADKIYPIEMRYGTNLTRLNETGTVFVRHLRERRVYWSQGIKAYTMALYDDDRAEGEYLKWQTMLRNYAAKNAQYEHAIPNR